MKTQCDIYEELRGKDLLNYKSSIYFDYNDFTVRISAHLPKSENIIENNGREAKMFFIFSEDAGLTTQKVQRYFEDSAFKNMEIDFFIVGEDEYSTIENIQKALNRF